MNSKAYERARNSLYGNMVRLIIRATRSSMGSRVTPGLLDQIFRQTKPIVDSSRTLARDISYRDYREFVGDTDLIPPLELNRFTDELWRGSLERHTNDFETLSAGAVEQIAMSADYWARDAEWGQRADVAKKDPRIWKVARVDPEPPSCPFCTLLNSRGPVYVSMESGSRTLHGGDQCLLIWVQKGQTDYPHKRSTDIAMEAYKRAVKSLGEEKRTPENILKALKAEQGETGPGKVRTNVKNNVASEQSIRVREVKSALTKLESLKTSTESGTRIRDEQVTRYRDIINSLEGAP